MKPSLLDPNFKYTPASNTDIRKTFAKARKELRDKEAKERADALERIAKVKPMTRSA